MTEATETPGPLEGIKVIDLGNILAGPLCATFLGDLGAEVVKFERPEIGDSMRHTGWKHEASSDSIWWKIVGRNKKSIAVDLRTPEGQETVRSLARHADVLIDGFRPGAMERWGIGWEDLHELNPRLVMARISGFGQTGPASSKPGFGTLAEAMSGLAAVTGWPETPPTLPSFGLADSLSALSAAIAVVAALHERDTGSGLGQMVDVALVEPLLMVLGAQLPTWELLGLKQERTGNRAPFVAPRGAYQCSDGKWIALSGSTPETAKRIFTAIGHPEFSDDPRFATNPDRVRNADALDEALSDWARERTREEALSVLLDQDVAAAAVYDAEDILADEHFTERQSYIRIDDPDFGSMSMPNVIHRLSRTPARVVHTGPSLDADGADFEAIVERWSADD